jgi:hypothetical protein
MKKLLLCSALLWVSLAAIPVFAQVQPPAADTQKTTTTQPTPAPTVIVQPAATQTPVVTAPAPVVTAPATATTAQPAEAKAEVVECAPADGWHQTVGWSVIVALIIMFGILTVKSNLLRASISDPQSFMTMARHVGKHKHETDINKIPKPFSLSRSQLGIWTLVIGCSYIYLELCKFVPTTQLPFDNTLLALMGISAGTAALSNVIDNSSTDEQHGFQQPSKGFFADILSDQNGINIHRFQNVMWTVIAITLYIGQIPHLTCGEMPMLDNTLIALTGISNATYLGLKVNENKPPALPPSDQTNPVPPVVPVPPTLVINPDPVAPAAS